MGYELSSLSGDYALVTRHLLKSLERQNVTYAEITPRRVLPFGGNRM